MHPPDLPDQSALSPHLNKIGVRLSAALAGSDHLASTPESYTHMPHATPIRGILALLLFALVTTLFAQSNTTLPSTAPTTQPATPSQPARPAPQRATVTLANNLLTVSASNSSLNQILREIARQTTMKITGGVADERVFGTYGPGSPAQILTALLDGTGSNMLLVQSPTHHLAELILTPRHGGVTPPNPNSAAFNDATEPTEISAQPDSRPVAGPSQSQPIPAQPTEPVSPAQAAAFPSLSPDPATNPQPAQPDATTQDNPNGVKTPQQIFEQLQRLHQQATPAPQ